VWIIIAIVDTRAPKNCLWKRQVDPRGNY